MARVCQSAGAVELIETGPPVGILRSSVRHVVRTQWLVLSLALALGGNLLPASSVAAAYNGVCEDSRYYGNMKYINERNRSVGITGVLMDIRARVLKPCVPGIISGSGSYVPA